MWCRKKFFKYWRVLVPALLLAALCRPGPGPAAEAGGGGSVTVPEEPPLVALTFDDGPRTSTTSRLLDGLALREIQATFFLVGDRIQGQEALVRRMAEDGHQIGVHSYDHSCISDLSRADFDLQVGRTRGVLSAVLGSGDFWLRPPYGIIDDAGLRWAGSPVVLWSVDPEDWKDQDTGRVVGSVLSHVGRQHHPAPRHLRQLSGRRSPDRGCPLRAGLLLCHGGAAPPGQGNPAPGRDCLPVRKIKI